LVGDNFDHDYCNSPVLFCERKIQVGLKEISFYIWDIGTQYSAHSNMLLFSKDLHTIFIVFDLSDIKSPNSIKNWYRYSRVHNKTCSFVLVGTKYDEYQLKIRDEQLFILTQARKCARAARCPLVFVSAKDNINVNNLLTVVAANALEGMPRPEMNCIVGEPVLEYYIEYERLSIYIISFITSLEIPINGLAQYSLQ